MMIVLRDNWQPAAYTRQVIVSDTVAAALAVPAGVNAAVVFVEKEATSTADYCIRAMLAGTTAPTEGSKIGAQFKQGDVITLEGDAQVLAFKAINTEAGKNNILHINWYYVRQ